MHLLVFMYVLTKCTAQEAKKIKCNFSGKDLRWGFIHCDLAQCGIEFYFDYLNLEDWIDSWYRNVKNKLSIHAV
jgi:hypothetical protein